MSDLGPWILGAVMSALSLLGLVIASRAHDGPFGLAGYLLFAFGALFVFWLVKKAFDDGERGER